jgi:cytochrome c oxidase subunit 3
MPGSTLIAEEIEVGRGGEPPARAGFGDGDSRGGEGFERTRRLYVTGVYLGLATVTMFFMALASAYLVRKGIGGDWRDLVLPRILWVNTVILVASSVTLEVARRKLAGGDVQEFRNWWAITTALGTLFLGGQIVAWAQLAEQGFFLATNPSSSFFYLLTAAHGAHLLLGVAVLAVVALRSWADTRVTRDVAAEVAGIFWHFLDGLWVFLIVLLQFGR